MTLFDDLPVAVAAPSLTESEAKCRGMAIAADSNKSCLDYLRNAVKLRWRALKAAGVRSYVTAEDARELLEIGIELNVYERPKNTFFMGSLFQGKEWEFTGERIQSTLKGSHLREIKCWKYVGEGE